VRRDRVEGERTEKEARVFKDRVYREKER